MKPQVIRVQRGIWTWWVVGTATAAVLGDTWETQAQVIGRWERKYGRPEGGYILVRGYHTERAANALLSRVRLVEVVTDPTELSEDVALAAVLGGGARAG